MTRHTENFSGRPVSVVSPDDSRNVMRITLTRGLFFDLFIALTSGLFFSLIAVVLFAMVTTTSLHEFFHQLRSPVVFSAVWISLQTSFAVVFLTFFFGFPISYLLALNHFKGKAILETLLDFPIVMPPLISGLALLIFLSGDGLAGRILNHWNISLIFTKKGIILAQLFVAAPFFIKTAKESIGAIPKNLLAASATLSASKFFTFRRLILPLSKTGILAGLIMAWARALGEFGATAMVAGCIPRQTETITIAIYMHAMSGNLETSTALALVLMVFSFCSLLVFRAIFKKKRENGYYA
ncbi:MAG TPA: ABC transporter permease [Desulfobacterales bacterium]|nr:ABC transporter permease [Desulfobacterales bacterium]